MGFINWLLGITDEQAREIARQRAERERQILARPSVISEMDQGDYHSGPEGYSANTAYPETQYGSMWDEDAEWNEEH